MLQQNICPARIKEQVKLSKEKTKVYIYTRVSTAMQIDGYSLDAQRTRMKAYADFNDFEIAGEYEDAGKSGKSIEGRNEFNRMMEDIKTGKDGISYVLVFKLSRFGRNAADVLSTLQTMQDFGVNLICVEDGIDSSKDAGNHGGPDTESTGRKMEWRLSALRL